jgi:hypothetical protein
MKNQDWYKYEQYSIQYHQKLFPEYQVWHWSLVPEKVLIDTGFIHNLTAHRLQRKKRKVETGHSYINEMQEYGFDGIAGLYDQTVNTSHPIQCKKENIY